MRSQVLSGNFLLDDGRLPLPSGWCVREVGSRRFAHCVTLDVTEVVDRDGTGWLVATDRLLPAGPAVQVADRVAQTTGRRFLRDEGDLHGRFLLLSKDLLAVDAFSMLPVYVIPGAAASHLELLAPGAHRRSTVEWRDALNWYPPPATPVPGVKKLLASQALDLSHWVPVPRPLLVPASTSSQQEERAGNASTLLRALTEPLRSLEGEVLVPLTAGHDSRLVLALAHAEEFDVSCFTQLHPRMSIADRDLPPRIAAAVGAPHQVVPRARTRRSASALALYDQRVGGALKDADRDFWAFDQFRFWRSPSPFLLRGVGFELGRSFYRSLPDVPSLAALQQRFRPKHEVLARGLADWFEWSLDHPEDMDWRDRLYWEQRVGGWVAANEAGLDLTGARRVNMALTRAAASKLVRLPERLRQDGSHQAQLVRELVPALGNLPYNPQDPWTRPATWSRAAVTLPRRALRRLRRGRA